MAELPTGPIADSLCGDHGEPLTANDLLETLSGAIVCLAGDLDACIEIPIDLDPTSPGEAPAANRTYVVEHGLAQAPAVWEPAVWLRDSGEATVLATRVFSPTAFKVTFPAGVLTIDATKTVRLRARVG